MLALMLHAFVLVWVLLMILLVAEDCSPSPMTMKSPWGGGSETSLDGLSDRDLDLAPEGLELCRRSVEDGRSSSVETSGSMKTPPESTPFKIRPDVPTVEVSSVIQPVPTHQPSQP